MYMHFKITLQMLVRTDVFTLDVPIDDYAKNGGPGEPGLTFM